MHKAFLEDARLINKSAYTFGSPHPEVPFQSYPYIASPDRNPRWASELEALTYSGHIQNLDGAYRVAMYLLLTVATAPVLYSGDEIMQRGWQWNGNQRNHEVPGDGSNIFKETLSEPFPWYTEGDGPRQTKWFASKYDHPNDGISKEEQDRAGGILALVRGLTNLRARHEVLREGSLGEILDDNALWTTFERVKGDVRYLVLVNSSPIGKEYHFHEQWHPQYRNAKVIYWSDGASKEWKDVSDTELKINSSVSVPPYGMVILRGNEKTGSTAFTPLKAE
jgi:hypothetical protein